MNKKKLAKRLFGGVLSAFLLCGTALAQDMRGIDAVRHPYKQSSIIEAKFGAGPSVIIRRLSRDAIEIKGARYLLVDSEYEFSEKGKPPEQRILRFKFPFDGGRFEAHEVAMRQGAGPNEKAVSLMQAGAKDVTNRIFLEGEFSGFQKGRALSSAVVKAVRVEDQIGGFVYDVPNSSGFFGRMVEETVAAMEQAESGKLTLLPEFWDRSNARVGLPGQTQLLQKNF